MALRTGFAAGVPFSWDDRLELDGPDQAIPVTVTES
jgi:hypothetical protein